MYGTGGGEGDPSVLELGSLPVHTSPIDDYRPLTLPIHTSPIDDYRPLTLPVVHSVHKGSPWFT